MSVKSKCYYDESKKKIHSAAYQVYAVRGNL